MILNKNDLEVLIYSTADGLINNKENAVRITHKPSGIVREKSGYPIRKLIEDSISEIKIELNIKNPEPENYINVVKLYKGEEGPLVCKSNEFDSIIEELQEFHKDETFHKDYRFEGTYYKVVWDIMDKEEYSKLEEFAGW